MSNCLDIDHYSGLVFFYNHMFNLLVSGQIILDQSSLLSNIWM